MVKSSRARTMKRFKPRFATVGFNRDVEKKYMDKALVTFSARPYRSGTNDGLNTSDGFAWTSNEWKPYDFAGPPSTDPGMTSNDLLKGLAQNTTAQTRIGNRVTGRYIKGSITMTATKIVGTSLGQTNGDQNGEAVATLGNATNIYQYLRTTFRCVLVKDLQVNSTDTKIEWNDVFESGGSAVGETGGVHAELKVANMGRFRILEDKLVKCNAINPQETVQFTIAGKDVGHVRYNGPAAGALTDQGIYVIWAAYSNGTTVGASATDGLTAPNVTLHSRLCFTDA